MSLEERKCNTYLKTTKEMEELKREGPFRIIEEQGRHGIIAKSIHSRLSIDRHTINEDQGTLTFWVMPNETLTSSHTPAELRPYEPMYYYYTLLSDIEDMKNVSEASFAFFWNSRRFRQLSAKFYKGNIYWDALYPDRALASSGDNVTLIEKNWYQLGVTWDRIKGFYRVFVNGIPVGSSSVYADEVEHHKSGDSLYMGNPVFVLSELSFYDTVLSDAEMSEAFYSEATCINSDVQEDLLKMHVGAGLEKYSWKPIDPKWELKLDVPFDKEEDMDLFQVQGCPGTPCITDKGLLFETSMVRSQSAMDHFGTPSEEIDDPDQDYFWSRDYFEGDIAVEYEFMPLQDNGLSVLIVQASGMQHEDFMQDYPLRTSGSMRVVWGENVRNYDWEYYREMDDIRHDTESHLLNKNPWEYQLAYQCQPQLWKKDEWYKIQFIQEGERIRGTINGTLIFDVRDRPSDQRGPTLNCGRIAIRCMWKTRLLVKNLKVYSKPIFENGYDI